MKRYVIIATLWFLFPIVSAGVVIPALARTTGSDVLPWQFISTPNIGAMHTGQAGYAQNWALVIDWKRHGWLQPKAFIDTTSTVKTDPRYETDVYLRRVQGGATVVINACSTGATWERQRHVRRGLIRVVTFSLQYCGQRGPFP